MIAMRPVQAYVLRRAFDAIDIPLVVRLAELAGVDLPRVTASTHRIPASVPAGSTRVTCSFEMSLALIEALRHRAMRAEKDEDDDLLIAISDALAALFAAIEKYRTPRGTTETGAAPY